MTHPLFPILIVTALPLIVVIGISWLILYHLTEYGDL